MNSTGNSNRNRSWSKRLRFRAALGCIGFALIAILVASASEPEQLLKDAALKASKKLTDLIVDPDSVPQVNETVTEKPCHFRMVWTGDPCTETRIAWNSNSGAGDHLLRWREAGETAFHQTKATTGKFSYSQHKCLKKRAPLDLFYHQVELDGLRPDAKYEVQCVSGGHASREFYFITAPGGDKPFSLLVGGDSRSGRKARRKMNRMMAHLVSFSESSNEPSDRLLGIVHGGDYAAVGNNLLLWVGWMADHESLVTGKGRLIPLIPARGNHDTGVLFNECFGFESNDDRNYYGVSFGSLLRLVTLNTETTVAGDQAKWLDKELSRSTPTHRWVVPQYHRPAFPAVKTPGSALAHWVPLFDKHGVRLACEADGHVIKRTLPIRNGKHDAKGVVYVGEGGFGVGQRKPKTDRWYLQDPGMCARGHHVQRVKFEKDALLYECIVLSGSDRNRVRIVDRHAISHGSRLDARTGRDKRTERK